METRTRTSLLRSPTDALAGVRDGDRIGVGGSVIADHPMVLVRELIRRRTRQIALVVTTAGLDADLLIAAGCVGRITAAYVGAEALAPAGPAFRRAVSSGELPVYEMDEGLIVQGLRAASQGLPFLPWRGGVGTSLPELNPELVEFIDPIKGERLLAVPAIELDWALIHADRADVYGNVQIDGTGHMDMLLAAAAKRVIVQADHVVDNDVIRANPGATHFWRDTVVVRAPDGAHPFATAQLETDVDALNEYVAAVSGGPDSLAAYLGRWVFSPADHDEYLERVGADRLAALRV